MFFREAVSKNSKSSVLQLVENIRTEKGPRQRIIVSLGTYLRIPKEKRSEVARIVQERLSGQQSLFQYDSQAFAYADKIVKKIQTEGKWNSAREQAAKFAEVEKDKNIAEIFVDEVQHGYDRELGPLLIGDYFWKKLNFPSILSDCDFNERQIKTAQLSVLNRLIAQDSEHSTVSWLQTVAVEEIIDIDVSQIAHDRFYRISDKLLKNQEHIYCKA
jgi:hypothetical protein